MPPTLFYQFGIEVLPSTPLSAPFTANIAFPPCDVDTIEIKLPKGSNGAVGFQLGSSGAVVIPYNPNEFIVGSDDFFTWDVTGQFDSGAWQLVAYNTGFFPHYIYVRFLCSPIVPTGPAVSSLISMATLNAS